MKIVRVILILVCLNFVAGCGQKGDLYFPEQRAETSSLAGQVPWLESYGFF